MLVIVSNFGLVCPCLLLRQCQPSPNLSTSPFRMDPLEEGRLMVLRLPPVVGPPECPPYGMLPLTTDTHVVAPSAEMVMFPYADLLCWSEVSHFSAMPVLARALQGLHDACSSITKQLLWSLAPMTRAFQVRLLSYSRMLHMGSLSGKPNQHKLHTILREECCMKFGEYYHL